MRPSSLSSEIQTILQERGIPNVIREIALFLQRMDNFSNCLLKVTGADICFSLNGTVLIKHASSTGEVLEERGQRGNKMKKEDAFLQKIRPENVTVPSFTSLDTFFENQVISDPPSTGRTDFDKFIMTVKRLENGMSCLKEVSCFTSVTKQLMMFFLFTILEEFQMRFPAIDSADSHKIICQALGYVHDDSKRRFRERLQKMKCLGELANLFGKDVLLIPKLGFRTFFLMSEDSKNYIREQSNFPNKKLGDNIFFESIQNISELYFNLGAHPTLGRVLFPFFRNSEQSGNSLIVSRATLEESSSERGTAESPSAPCSDAEEINLQYLQSEALDGEDKNGFDDNRQSEHMEYHQNMELAPDSSDMPNAANSDILAETPDDIPPFPTSPSQNSSHLAYLAMIREQNTRPLAFSTPPSPRKDLARLHSASPIVEIVSPKKKRQSLIERAAQKFRRI